MQTNLMQQGVELMLFGMGTVFVFLALLVLATTLMSHLVGRWVRTDATAVDPSPVPLEPNSDKRLLAIITAAIHQHRSKS